MGKAKKKYPLRISFDESILDTIEVQHPSTAAKLTYNEYLKLDQSFRTSDEKPFVDQVFTPRLLQWLDYTESDYRYDANSKEGSIDRPDFLVRPTQSVAFVIEDKNSTLEFSQAHLTQLRKYTAGTQGYALWTNSRIVLALRFFPGGEHDVLARIAVHEDESSLFDGDGSSLELFRLLFEKQRFVSIPGILNRICIDKETWEREARPLDSPDTQVAFISETKELLDKLTLAARVQIERAELDLTEAKRDTAAIQTELEVQASELVSIVESLPKNTADVIQQNLQKLISDPLNLDEDDLRNLKPKELEGITLTAWIRRLNSMISILADFRERESQRLRSRRIHNSYEVWRDRYRIIEGEKATTTDRIVAYAEQVAYALFIRLVLARVLEDKGAIPRLISDGGLKAWREIVQPSDNTQSEEVMLHSRALLDILFQTVAKFYQHFFNQPVFDWFIPDDYLLVIALERLSTFSFHKINRDILGYTYEAYVDRAFRGLKGHFLTKGDIVDAILDEVGFKGREVIGKQILDPAAGSGSFLVHAARRVREALAEAMHDIFDDETERRTELAIKFIDCVQSDFVGLDINPFSCYLAELNLFLQVLDDVLYLHSKAEEFIPVEKFCIYNTDSLVLSYATLQNTRSLDDETKELGHDQAKQIKLTRKTSFDYVVMNPPYINRGIQHDLTDLTKIPFYALIFGGGDTNYYQAFIRLANYYVKTNGVVGLICPLQLYGDKSAGNIRGWLAAPISGKPPDGLRADWSIKSLIRIYSRTVLFDDVLQAVCISVWQRKPLDEKSATIKVAGGYDLSDALANSAIHQASRIVATDPAHTLMSQSTSEVTDETASVHDLQISDNWHNNWAVVLEDEILDAWERIRDNSATDIATWSSSYEHRLVFQQGDVNATRTKPLRPVVDGGQVRGELKSAIPIAGGKDTLPFGPYSVSSYLDADADVASMNISDRQKADADRERRERVKRIHELKGIEAVCVLKEISGIESARPIMGALYHRGKDKASICFGHTTQIVFAKRIENSIVTEAAFGLLVSSTANFIFSLFSTNQHVGKYEIERILIPDLVDAQIKELGKLAVYVQKKGTEYWEEKCNLGCGVALIDRDPDPRIILNTPEMGIETESLEAAVLRNHLRIDHRPWRVAKMFERDFISVVESVEDESYRKCLQILLSLENRNYDEAKSEVLLPFPAMAREYLKKLNGTRNRLEEKFTSLCQALASLDTYTLAMYGITDTDTVKLIGRGMPWACQQKDFAGKIVSLY